jgi:hypothetical protein
MLLRAASRAIQDPTLLVGETLSEDISREQAIANIEAFGLVADRSLVLDPLSNFLKSSDSLVVEAAIHALRLLYIRDTQAFPCYVRKALVEIATQSTIPSIRLLGAMCLADFSFLET